MPMLKVFVFVAGPLLNFPKQLRIVSIFSTFMKIDFCVFFLILETIRILFHSFNLDRQFSVYASKNKYIALQKSLLSMCLSNLKKKLLSP